MTLIAGTRIGVYEISSLLGAGGMGEVYRAHDTKLNRDVALKVLLPEVADNPERLARFRREAQVLAALNHTNIAHIHGLEEAEGTTALVLEFVDGPTLADMIADGPMAIDEALPVAMQIAEALDAAHEQGIIHRDLKPANIKVRSDGTVKVLDFGLAKAMDPPSVIAPTATRSPTITSPALMTGVGVILGTAAYMSPEQARGKTVDRRADVWAFGCVVYEMLTGQRAFGGEDVAETLANVINKEPAWETLPAAVPTHVRQTLRVCLRKLIRERVPDIGAVRLALEGAFEATSPQTTTGVPRSAGLTRATWVMAIVAVLVASALAVSAFRYVGRTGPEPEAIQFTLLPPQNAQFGGPEGPGSGTEIQAAISPDGRQIVFVARAESGYQLWLRPIGGLTARVIPDTEDAAYPFWSPDSRFVGFFTSGKLKKVSIGGGPSVVLCDVRSGRGGSWNRDNIIIFGSTSRGGIQRVSSGGGPPAPATAIDTAYGESSHRWPSFLPDGRHFLYTGVAGAFQGRAGRVRIGDLDAAETSTLFEVESSVAYASGYLLSNHLGKLVARRFDPDSRQVAGEGVLVADSVGLEGSRYASFSVSDEGVLLYAAPLNQGEGQLTWMDRAGRNPAPVGEVARYVGPSLSRGDTRNIAVRIFSGGPQNNDLFVLDTQGKPRRLTFEAGGSGAPIWSPDGQRIAFSASRQGAPTPTLRQRLVSGAGEDEELLDIGGFIVPTDWSADGQFIAYNRIGADGSSDIWVLALAQNTPAPFAQTTKDEAYATFSPDSHWIAYQESAENTRTEVYVRSFPRGSGQPYQISRGGGRFPKWSADGKEIFFVAPNNTMTAVTIDASRPSQLGPPGAPRALFKMPALVPLSGRPYDVSKDGQRFLVSVPTEQATPAPITVVVNWLATIQH